MVLTDIAPHKNHEPQENNEKTDSYNIPYVQYSLKKCRDILEEQLGTIQEFDSVRVNFIDPVKKFKDQGLNEEIIMDLIDQTK
jgi:hypothetical protein